MMRLRQSVVQIPPGQIETLLLLPLDTIEPECDEAFRQSRRYANAKRGLRPQLPRLCDWPLATLRDRTM